MNQAGLYHQPIYEGTILSVKKGKFWDVVEEETGVGLPDGGKSMTITYALTKDGNYIGNTSTASRLNRKYGIITFEPRDYEEGIRRICSIGWSERNKLWYGWSHRAIHGFKDKRQAKAFARRVS